MKDVIYGPIGVIRSEHTVADLTLIQPVYAKNCRGRAEIFPDFAEGLRDLEGFSHLYLLYHFHEAGPVKLRVKPFLQDIERGVFSTRAPCRPNPIGLSIVELLRREGNILYFAGLDILARLSWTSSRIWPNLIAEKERAMAGRMGWTKRLRTDGVKEAIAAGRRHDSSDRVRFFCRVGRSTGHCRLRR